MDKLSLYEILSFIIPGFILIKIFETYNYYVFFNEPLFNEVGKFEENILLFFLSLFLGILLHIITFRFLKTSRLKWFNRLIFKSVQEISVSNEFIQKVIPFLNKDYILVRKHTEDEVKPNEAENNLFDFAYLYLEINDKITPAKNFQSMYFWFRNMFTMCIILFPVSIIIYGLTYYFELSLTQKNSALLIALATLIIALVIIPTANWLRDKLIEKVLWSYYVERVIKNEKIK